MSWEFASALPGMVWPAVPSPRAAEVLALLFQMQQAERLAPRGLAALQGTQVRSLLKHAWTSVPFYREHWGAERHFEKLPVLTRRHIQERFADLKSRAVPPAHGRITETVSSGSTGMPLRVQRTALVTRYWHANTLREHAWHKRDLSARLAVIRKGVKSSADAPSWGGATAGVVRTGPAAGLDIGTEIGAQLDWLVAQAPRYLLTFAHNAGALAKAALERGIRIPSLVEVRTIGELLSEETRLLCRQAWNVPVTDIYSANEVGYMALQCPAGESYHVLSDSVVLEVLKEDGSACAPGEVGKVTVTSLNNFAMPLVRYEIGDYAELGSACACGRSLPVLRRIIGRSRNTLVAPDGRRYYPSLSLHRMTDVANIRQFQMVQPARELLEVRLVVPAPLPPEEEKALEAKILAKLPPGMSVRFAYVERIERNAGGKYEDFISQVA